MPSVRLSHEVSFTLTVVSPAPAAITEGVTSKPLVADTCMSFCKLAPLTVKVALFPVPSITSESVDAVRLAKAGA